MLVKVTVRYNSIRKEISAMSQWWHGLAPSTKMVLMFMAGAMINALTEELQSVYSVFGVKTLLAGLSVLGGFLLRSPVGQNSGPVDPPKAG